jgi:hypothetical protein
MGDLNVRIINERLVEQNFQPWRWPGTRYELLTESWNVQTVSLNSFEKDLVAGDCGGVSWLGSGLPSERTNNPYGKHSRNWTIYLRAGLIPRIVMDVLRAL